MIDFLRFLDKIYIFFYLVHLYPLGGNWLNHFLCMIYIYVCDDCVKILVEYLKV